jgi:outer membrane protein OmpA-like peptidoglycan-associated protein
MRKLLVTLLLLAIVPAVFAFESTLTVEGGVSIPVDDIDGSNEMMGAWALAWDGWFFGDLGVGFSPWFTNLKVKDGPDYYSSLEGANIYLKYKPTKFLALNFPNEYVINRISPFIVAGAGISTHGSEDEFGNTDITSLQPLKYHWTLPHAAAGISFLSKWNTTLDLGVKYDLFTVDKVDMVEAGDMNDAIITPYIGLGIHFGGRKDKDKDGIEDKKDGDPNNPEDIDGYLDADGIPDPDNDADLILDVNDQAPGTDQTVRDGIDTKETYNGYQDTDGVPDMIPLSMMDSDNDGIMDDKDKAPNAPEDRDGYMDNDGIPDPDNDGDGIMDIADGAPNDAEDKDNFKDFDGIPDPDNDDDKILDVNDLAPGTDDTVKNNVDTKETYNDYEDTDGVPDSVPETPKPDDKDSDGDGIPDSRDKAPFAAEDRDGFMDNDGIPDPDNDGDGILDVVDGAPNDAEDKDAFEDADGIPDPDNDQDGINDVNDLAPGTDETVRKGIDTKETYNDFEDTDGVPDVNPAMQDSDGDGIPDSRDKAPFAPEDRDGYMDSDGIPDPDNDGDGILDVNDGAPNDAEDKDSFEDADGIPDPDNDQDGIPDKDDKAPGTDMTVSQGIDTKETYNGFEDTDGVPDTLPIDPELAQLEQDLAQHMVHFDTNLYKIRDNDKPFLDRVVASLKLLPDVKIQIQGHTDNTGNDGINIPLSHNRAKVVRDYLVARGIKEDQLDIKGFSSTVPVQSNATPAGRQANRRAQMVIVK